MVITKRGFDMFGGSQREAYKFNATKVFPQFHTHALLILRKFSSLIREQRLS